MVHIVTKRMGHEFWTEKRAWGSRKNKDGQSVSEQIHGLTAEKYPQPACNE